jgi:hypothetical protein
MPPIACGYQYRLSKKAAAAVTLLSVSMYIGVITLLILSYPNLALALLLTIYWLPFLIGDLIYSNDIKKKLSDPEFAIEFIYKEGVFTKSLLRKFCDENPGEFLMSDTYLVSHILKKLTDDSGYDENPGKRLKYHKIGDALYESIKFSDNAAKKHERAMLFTIIGVIIGIILLEVICAYIGHSVFVLAAFGPVLIMILGLIIFYPIKKYIAEKIAVPEVTFRCLRSGNFAKNILNRTKSADMKNYVNLILTVKSKREENEKCSKEI